MTHGDGETRSDATPATGPLDTWLRDGDRFDPDAEIAAWDAHNEPVRRAERLECGIVDAEAVAEADRIEAVEREVQERLAGGELERRREAIMDEVRGHSPGDDEPSDAEIVAGVRWLADDAEREGHPEKAESLRGRAAAMEHEGVDAHLRRVLDQVPAQPLTVAESAPRSPAEDLAAELVAHVANWDGTPIRHPFTPIAYADPDGRPFLTDWCGHSDGPDTICGRLIGEHHPGNFELDDFVEGARMEHDRDPEAWHRAMLAPPRTLSTSCDFCGLPWPEQA